jgi:hypothetical protein
MAAAGRLSAVKVARNQNFEILRSAGHSAAKKSRRAA